MQCYLCEMDEALESSISLKDVTLVECDICGKYEMDGFFRSTYENMDVTEKAKYSAYTKEAYELGKVPPFIGDPEKMEEEVEEFTNKSLDEKIENMLLYIKKRSKHFGDIVEWDDNRNFPVTYSATPTETEELRKAAEEEGLLVNKENVVKLKKPGWDRAVEAEKRKVPPGRIVL